MNRISAVRRRSILPLIPTVLVLSLAGCLRDRDHRDDPLLGLPNRIPDSRSSVSVREPGAGGPLASVAGRSDSGLGIRDNNSPPASTVDRGVQPTGWTGTTPPASDAAPRLQTPVVPRDPRTASTSPAPTGGPLRIRTFEEAAAFLSARNCRWQRLEQREGEWFFSCSVPSRTNPNSVKTYEATDKYGLLAMQKVIDEINRDQTR